MEGDDLTDPLIASRTTAFMRSIIGECLHEIQRIEGLVCFGNHRWFYY